MEQVELGAIAKEAGLVDGQVFQQPGQFRLAGLADQKPVVAVERIDLAFSQAAQQAILQEVGAALVEMHAAFLVNQRLQKFQFRIGKRGCRCCS